MKQKQLAEEQRIKKESEAKQYRLLMAANLPIEPPVPKTPAAEVFLKTPHGSAGITTIRFRLPLDADQNGRISQMANFIKNGIVVRRFAGLDTLEHLFIYMESLGFSISNYRLLTTYPIRDVCFVKYPNYLSNFF